MEEEELVEEEVLQEVVVLVDIIAITLLVEQEVLVQLLHQVGRQDILEEAEVVQQVVQHHFTEAEEVVEVAYLD